MNTACRESFPQSSQIDPLAGRYHVLNTAHQRHAMEIQKNVLRETPIERVVIVFQRMQLSSEWSQ